MTSTAPGAPRPLGALIRDIDDVLRGRYTSRESLSTGHIGIRVAPLVRCAVPLAAVYGAGLGTFGFQHLGSGEGALQVVSAAVKLPLLFLLTLAVTFPSLYVFGALLRLPLGSLATLRLLMIAVLVNAAVLASLAPVFAFFAISTRSYDFMLQLNVLFAGVGGLISLSTLSRASRTLMGDTEAAQRAAGRRLLVVWCLLYGTVGAQMAWLLRPFLGAPSQPFALLRPTDSNFFEAVLQSIGRLFSGS